MQCRVGLIGVGGIGIKQADKLNRNPEKWKLVGVADTSKISYAYFQQKFYNSRLPFYDNAWDLIEHEKPDVAIISTTARSHVQIIQSLIQKGFTGSILVEKPISTCIEDAKLLQSTIQNLSWKGKIGVDYQRRCSKLYQEVKKLITSGAIGRLEKLTVTRLGKISMHGSHFVDLGCFMTNSQPISVSANLHDNSMRDHRGASLFDPAGIVIVNFDNGVELKLNLVEDQPHDQFISIQGSEGSIFVNRSETIATIQMDQNHRPLITSDQNQMDWFENTVENIVFNEEARIFTPTSLEESISNLEVIVGAFVSAELKGQV